MKLETMKAWRKEHRVSLREMSALTGISTAELSRAERGKTTLSPMRCLMIARITGLSLEHLLRG